MNEINLFNFAFPKYKITKPVKLIELFGGIGSQAKALENLGVDFEHYKLVEFDEHCIKVYNAIHNTHFVTQDITKIKGNDLEIKDTHLFTYLLTRFLAKIYQLLVCKKECKKQQTQEVLCYGK